MTIKHENKMPIDEVIKSITNLYWQAKSYGLVGEAELYKNIEILLNELKQARLQMVDTTNENRADRCRRS